MAISPILLGVIIGAVIGAIIGAWYVQSHLGENLDNFGEGATALWAFMGALIFGGIGAALAALFTKKSKSNYVNFYKYEEDEKKKKNNVNY